MVKNFIMEKVTSIFEALKDDIKLTTGEFEAERHEWFSKEINDAANGAYENGMMDAERGRR